MLEIIDLSQEIYSGMPVFPGLPEVHITLHVSHEEWDGIIDSDLVSPAVNRLEMGEHTATHVDAPLHFIPGGMHAGALPLARLMGMATLINVANLLYVVAYFTLDMLRLRLMTVTVATCSRSFS